MYVQAVPFPFFIEPVSGKTSYHRISGADNGVAAAPSWHGADVTVTSAVCYGAYSGIYLT